ncbi:hypothetical protein N0V90_002861 [Kalmusia sp. IMI 367209]|nr:hypothetical protein N0V90_002861 [Kalmusia sp. IMI 367209]
MFAKSYVFGEKIMDNKYKNAILKQMMDFALSKGSPARTLMVDILVELAHSDSKNWMRDVELYSKELLTDIVKAIMVTRTAPATYS